jgi:drug/metabolite transporter (DMT)-like permease
MLRSLLLERHLTYFQAAFYSCFAYFMFAISDAMAKWLQVEGFDKSTIIVLNSIPALIVLIVLMIKRHGIKRALHTKYKYLHVARAITLVGITFFMFKAVQALTLADFYGVVFTTPFILTIVAFFVLGERASLSEWIAIIIGFCGVMIVVQPDFSNFNFGYLYAFGAVICVTMTTFIVRRIGRDEDPYLFVIFGSMGLVIANIIPAITVVTPAFNWVHIIVFAIYAFTIPTAVLTMSAVFARAPSITAVAPFQYSQIIWGTVLGYIIFGDIPQMNTVIGSAIIVACGLYILFHHKRK